MPGSCRYNYCIVMLIWHASGPFTPPPGTAVDITGMRFVLINCKSVLAKMLTSKLMSGLTSALTSTLASPMPERRKK